MSQAPLRFVHAADLHLERPLSGVAQIPSHLREAFLEAPYMAAEQVIETALAEGADALVLAGDVVHLDRAGPRAIVFLLEQFKRLADHGIAVYWAGGQVDPADAWPPSVPLPSLVHRFPAGRVGNVEHQRDGKCVMRVQGVSRSPGQAPDDSGFFRDAKGLFTVGVAHGTAASAGQEGDRVHYMALGGQHRRQTVDQSPGIAHYAGTPQGRQPAEVGAHGCTVVTVDEAGHVKTTFVATDVLRWITETVELTAGADEATLVSQMDARIAAVKGKHPDRDLLITWKVAGRGTLLNQLRPGGLSDELLDAMRQKYGQGSPAVWSVDLLCEEPLCAPAEWYDEETIRGDVLRQLRELENGAGVDLKLDEFLPEGVRSGNYEELANVGSAERGPLLTAASKLAMDLLSVGDDES